MSTDAAASPTGLSPNSPAPLPTDVALCHAIIGEQSSTIETLQRKLTQIEHYLEQLVRHRFGQRSEKLDPNQLPLFDAAANGEPNAGPQPEPKTADLPIKAHVRRGGGRMQIPKDWPRDRREYDLAENEKDCPGCGQRRDRIGCETSEQLEYVPAKLLVIEHVRWKYACRHCQEQVALAPKPPQPIDKGIPGPGLLAHLTVSKHSEHLPLYRLEDVMARHGVLLSRGTMCRWLGQTADLLMPLYELMVARVRSSRILWTDDMPVPVFDPELPKTRIGRFWVYCGDRRNPYTVYDFTPTRGRDGPVNFLAGFRGYLEADAYAGYEVIYATGTVQPVFCWAHARRKFFEAKESQPTEAHTALAFIHRLYEVERTAKEFAPEERRALRQAESLPILQEFQAWLAALEPTLRPKSPVGQALGYVLPRWAGFTRYCDDGELTIDNNVSERRIRPCAIGRKNWLFCGSDRGGRTAAMLLSFTATCKVLSIEPFAYLRDVLTQLPLLPRPADGPPALDRLAPFLPDAWLTAHPDARRVRPR